MLTRLKSLFQSTTVTATTVMEVDDPRLILQAYEPAFWITSTSSGAPGNAVFYYAPKVFLKNYWTEVPAYAKQFASGQAEAILENLIAEAALGRFITKEELRDCYQLKLVDPALLTNKS